MCNGGRVFSRTRTIATASTSTTTTPLYLVPELKSGTKLDKGLSRHSEGQCSRACIPPVVEERAQGGELWSLSNRRLFAFRVLANLRASSRVPTKIFTEKHLRETRVRWDDRLQRRATSGDRRHSTQCEGRQGKVRSWNWRRQPSASLESQYGFFTSTKRFHV